MTKEDVEDILADMARTKPDVIDEITASGIEPLINEDMSDLTIEELVEVLEVETGLEFNI